MVEFSFDRDEFRPDPSDRRREAERREDRERQMDEQRQLDALRDEQRREMERDAQEEALRRVVNDPDIVVDDVLKQVINDPTMKMDKSMTVRRTGRQQIARSGQFSRASLVGGINLAEMIPKKRTRKKTKTDKSMSAALAQAHKELRKANGQLRKGVTKSDVLKRAHRIRRKNSS